MVLPKETVLVTGCPDWAFGYQTRINERTLLIAIKAKQVRTYGRREYQLIPDLAILQEDRRRRNKTNITTMGFFSDGERFTFIFLTADRRILKSRQYGISHREDLKLVFNFIINMMETTIKWTPTATPTKPGQKGVWEQVFTVKDSEDVL